MFKKNENLGSQKRDLYKTVHSSHSHNGPKLEIAQIPRKLEKKIKLPYICTMEYCSGTKMSKLLIHFTTQMNLKIIMLGKK